MNNLPIRGKMSILYVNMSIFTFAFIFVVFGVMNAIHGRQAQAADGAAVQMVKMQEIQALLLEPAAALQNASLSGVEADMQQALTLTAQTAEAIETAYQAYKDTGASTQGDGFVSAMDGAQGQAYKRALEEATVYIAAGERPAYAAAGIAVAASPLAQAAQTRSMQLMDGMQADSAGDGQLIRNMIWFTAGFIVVYLAVTLVIGRYLAKLIAFPVKEMSACAQRIAQGDVDVQVSYVSRDEIGGLADTFRAMLEGIRQQADALSVIAQGDYTGAIDVRSQQDVVNQAIQEMLNRNNELVSDIRLSAEHVSTGAHQIAQGAQNLAEGSTEQATSVEEVSHTIADVMEQSNENTQNAQKALKLTQNVSSQMNQSLKSMEEMLAAMREIDESSRNIQSVIQIIDNIAFQTNLLALNAAVEAAHAGQHGQGFAVVANEVRALAGQSTAAVKNTTELIENSVRNVERGNKLVDQTNANLQAAGEYVDENLRLIQQIATQSESQSESISSVNQKVSMISDVVQNNSANAQESAAAAQEMSAQAAMLNEVVSHFRLRENAGRIGGAPAPQAISASGTYSAEDESDLLNAPLHY